MESEVVANQGLISWGLIIAYVLIGLAVLSVVAGLVLGLIQDMKSGLLTLGALALVVVVFFLASAMSSGELSNSAKIHGLTAGMQKMISGGLITFYVLAALATVATGWDVVKSVAQGG